MNSKLSYAAKYFFLYVILFHITACSGGGGTSTPPVTSPTVQSVAPANGATGVALNSGVSVIFSEIIDATSITNATFTVSNLSNPTIAISATVSANSSSAVLRPGQPLLPNTTYTATLAKVVRNAAGTPLAADYTWTFTTGAALDNTPPSVVSTTPADGATGVLTNAVSVVFSEAVDPSTIGLQEFSISTGGLALPGTITCNGLSATFTPASSLVANAAYTVVINGAKDLAGNLLPVVSWSFTRGSVVFGTTPLVTNNSPADLATNLAVTTTASATFNVRMDPATLTTSTFQLLNGATPVPGRVSLDTAGTLATFTPTTQLAPNTTYTATITTGAKSISGTPLTSAFSWVFTTGISGDTVAPTVFSTVPAANATAVAKTDGISITFSEKIDVATLTPPNTVTVSSAGGAVTVSLTIDLAGTHLRITPSAALSPNTLYTVVIKNTVKDLAGNTLGANYTWSFTTGA